MEIDDTYEEAVNINETTTESVKEAEPAENAQNTEKLGNTIMVSDIYIFMLTVENHQFTWDQCNRTNSPKNWLTQHMWMKQYTSKNFWHYHFDYCSQVYKKKVTEGQEKV